MSALGHQQTWRLLERDVRFSGFGTNICFYATSAWFSRSVAYVLLGGNVIASTFYFSFKSSAAKRPRFDLKEKQCLREMEYDAYGRLNKFVH
jgi:hypothetical protein